MKGCLYTLVAAALLKEAVSFSEQQVQQKRTQLGSGGAPMKDWQEGMKVELEHGTKFKGTNVTNNDPTQTAKIVRAHLHESPKYYQALKRMEDNL